ncbi:MAG: Pr6Pr family membrane protein [Candidatus Nomurabacteria bacterium]|nr:Pr6Pr family membrane protein [Candidatus Nomurabacteria bacterium]
MKNKNLATIFRLILVAVCLYGVVLLLSVSGGNTLETLSFYTLQSNIVVLVFFAFLLIRTWQRKSAPPASIKGAVTVCITLTFLVYHFMLQPSFAKSPELQAYVFSPSNIIVHYIVPLMTIADWLLFDKKGSLKKLDPVKWLLIPLAYLIFAMVRAGFGPISIAGSRYPYFFLDIDKYGVGQVAINVLVVGAGFAVLGYVIYFIDLAMAKKLTKL